jgi:hypothetical protein
VVEIYKSIVGPEPLAELLAGHDFSRMFQKHDQHLERLIAQLQLDTGIVEFSRAEIGSIRAKRD